MADPERHAFVQETEEERFRLEASLARHLGNAECLTVASNGPTHEPARKPFPKSRRLSPAPLASGEFYGVLLDTCLSENGGRR